MGRWGGRGYDYDEKRGMWGGVVGGSTITTKGVLETGSSSTRVNFPNFPPELLPGYTSF